MRVVHQIAAIYETNTHYPHEGSPIPIIVAPIDGSSPYDKLILPIPRLEATALDAGRGGCGTATAAIISNLTIE